MTNNSNRVLSRFYVLLPLLAVLLLTACTSLEPSSTHPQEHSLIGQIWDVKAQRIITRDELLQQVRDAHYLLLGETHDNEVHHRIQTSIVEALARDRRPALAMEQFDIEHQTALNEAAAMPNTTTESIADAGQFDRKGWNWPLYEPLVAIALRNKLPIAAINLSRAEARRIVGQPQQLTEDPRFAALALSAAWNQQREDTLRHEIVAGHCGHAPATMLPGLMAAQRLRDATMAEALIARSATGAVAILGHGHARKDIGVPIYLTARVPRARVVSISLMEVEPAHRYASDYIAEEGAEFDFVWFTPAAQRENPCANLPPSLHSASPPSTHDTTR